MTPDAIARPRVDAAVTAFNRHSPFPAAGAFPTVTCSCGREFAGPRAQTWHRVEEVLAAAAAAASTVARGASAPVPTGGTPEQPRLMVGLGVFVDTGRDHGDPIGVANLELPLELLDRAPLPATEDALVAQLHQAYAWDRWLATVREAVEALAAPCSTCGGSTLCPGCLGASVDAYFCAPCGSSGRCLTCGLTDIVTPRRDGVPATLRLVSDQAPHSETPGT